MTWTVHIITVIPEMFPGTLDFSVVGRALKSKLWVMNLVDLRRFGPGGRVDDTPAGGGAGMVIKADVLEKALLSVPNYATCAKVYLSPKGELLAQDTCRQFLERDLILLCGRYEGVDQRFLDFYNFSEVRIADVVLSGGEVAAQVLLDATVRLIPGCLGSAESIKEESFSNNLLEYPQYTRPQIWQNLAIPEILFSGHHKKIQEWRHAQALKITQDKRPDLLARYNDGQTN